jgi:hypothetical protein
MLFPGAIVNGREGELTVKFAWLECIRCNVRLDELLLVKLADIVRALPTATWPNCKVVGLDINVDA